MTRVALLIATAVLAVPAIASAQELSERGTGEVRIEGAAPVACVLEPTATFQGSNATFREVDERRSRLDILNLVDGNTGEVIPFQAEISLPIICNAAHRVYVRTTQGGLTLVGPAQSAPGFSSRLLYTLGVEWAGQQRSGPSSQEIVINSSDAAQGLVNVSVSIGPNGDPLLAGAYADDLVIELEPAV